MKIQGVNGIFSLANSQDGKLLAAGDSNGTITVWSVPEQKQLASFQASSWQAWAVWKARTECLWQ